MDIDLNDDQQLLQDSTRRFVEDLAPIGRVRQLAEGRKPFSLDEWRSTAEQGWVALFVPEAFGGIAESAQGVMDAAIVAEELGRVVHTGPFLPACVAAFAIAQAGSDAQREAYLPALAAGETLVASAFGGRGPRAGLTPGAISVSREADGFVLNGEANFVEDGEASDAFIVTAMGNDGLSQFLVPASNRGVLAAPLDALDLGRRLATVRFEGARIQADAVLGTLGDAGTQFERQLQLAVVLQCAETVGVVDRAFEIALEYTQQRMVFGRPVASYQAIKHRLADHVTQLEGMKAVVAHAARAVETRAPDAAIAVSVAKSHCGRWATEIVRDCMHLHGGIGVTWEHDIHFYLRRAVSNEALWGTPAAHHERLCALAGM